MKKLITGYILLTVPLLLSVANLFAADFSSIGRTMGANDSIIVSNASGEVLYEKNADRRLIPASTLKILTSLVALKTLGEDYRFKTLIYSDGKNLKIRGTGDPLLISEVIDVMAREIVKRMDTVDNITLDPGFFKLNTGIPGRSDSYQPYDTIPCALCANFNTIFFKKRKNRYFSAEFQTPLIPFAMKRIRSSGLGRGRIALTPKSHENVLYFGELFKWFFERNGGTVKGKIRVGRITPGEDRLIFTFHSPFILQDAVARLLEYSNNYIANQLLMVSGAKLLGPPATLEKGVRAVYDYMNAELKGVEIKMAEGSGLSRRNRVSARNLHKVVLKFLPHWRLMKNKGRDWYKTGTLRGISTRAGYIRGRDAKLYPYVVMFNSPGKNAERIAIALRRIL